MKTHLRSAPSTLGDRLREVTQYAEVKRLADNVMLAQRQKQFRSLAILSLFAGEGKTLFTALMALAYADATQTRALVVDTATLRNPQALNLKQCLEGYHPLVETMSIEEYRRGSNGNGHSEEAQLNGSVIKPEILNGPVNILVKKESDQWLLRKMAEERADHYGLILLDTAPLTARNKGNIDPMLVARIADAAIVVVNPHLLQGPHLEEQLKILKDPAVRLAGIVSNEEYFL